MRDTWARSVRQWARLYQVRSLARICLNHQRRCCCRAHRGEGTGSVVGPCESCWCCVLLSLQQLCLLLYDRLFLIRCDSVYRRLHVMFVVVVVVGLRLLYCMAMPVA
jgi:hypothetical protein